MKTHLYNLAYQAGFALLLFPGIITNHQSVLAQLTPDTTLGMESSTIVSNELKDTITGGATRGSNLFHSFEKFNVDVGRSVYFANPINIQNILTRVTGNNVSNIFGKLGVEGNANLFLINPKGIYFGSGASLDIKGSFTASTASGIKFADNTVFSATNTSQPPLLTISVPVGLQWGNNQSGNINNAGNLTVGNGKNLTLLGNNVTNTGNLTAPGGKIQVLGNNINVLNPSKIDVSAPNQGGIVLIGGDYQGKGEINAQNTNIENGVNIKADGLINGDGGKVIVWADKNTKFAGNITANGGENSGNGGFVEVSGKENLIFRGDVKTTSLNGLNGTLLLDPTNITIASGSGESFTDSNDTQTIYQATVEEVSKVNNLILSADNDITIQNLSNNELNMYGGTGTIKFIADADKNGQGNFMMDNLNNTIKTNREQIIFSDFCNEIGCISYSLRQPLQGKNLEIIGGNLTLGNIDTSSFLGGGKITFTANGSITTGNINSSSVINNNNEENAVSASSAGEISLIAKGNITTKSINSDSLATGGHSENAGNITLTTTTGKITTEEISAQSLGYPLSPSIPSNYNPNFYTGHGGNIKLTAEGDIKTASLSSATTAFNSDNGNAGEISLKSNGNIITDNLYSFTNTFYGSSANGGNITLNGNGLINTKIINSSSSTTWGNTQNGGNIDIKNSNGSIYFESINSSSLSEAKGNVSNGGNINLTANNGGISALFFVKSDSTAYPTTSNMMSEAGKSGDINLTILSNNNDNIVIPYINSSATGQKGNGGAITIKGNQMNLISNIIKSDGVNGSNGGTITITAPEIKLIDSDLSSSSFSSGKSGTINLITTGNIELNNSRLFTSLEPGSTGIGGNINIQTKNIKLSNYSLIDTGTYSNANAGNININAENVTLIDSSSIRSLTTGIGNAGNIFLNVNNGEIFLNNSSNISTAATKTASGNSGNIYLLSRNLQLLNGSQVQSLTEGTGTSKAGEIIINADNNIRISGMDSNFRPSDLTALPPQNVRSSDYYLFDGSDAVAIIPGMFIPITDIGTNNSLNTAQQLTANDVTINPPDYANINVEYATRIPYISILGNGDNKVHVYQLKVNSGTRAIFDVDNGYIDTKLTIFNSQGEILASNDNASNFLGAAGSSTNQDPYLRYTFNGQGNYYVQLSNFDGQGVPSNFTLNISLQPNYVQSNISNNGQPSGIFAYTTGAGKAGNINLNTANLKLENGGAIAAFTNSSGQGGTININANNSVNLGGGSQNFTPMISVETNGAGKAGDITINTPNFNLSETARITATATQNATNTEQGGSITLNISKMNLAGVLEIFAETKGQAPAGTLKLNPYNNQNTLDLTLFPGSIISGSTLGSGNGGDFQISAPETINITGKGKLAVESTGSGNAGNIFITTQNLNITDGVKISASTTGNGKGGNININANNFTANNGGQLLTTTSENAQAGNIIIKVKDNITLDGTNTGLFATTEKGSTGNGGSIDIDPEIFIIRNGAGIGVNSQGSGKGGNIKIAAGTLTLDNKAFITAETISNEGGEITLNINDLLWLRNNSNITATAGTAGAGGNGGNININAPFIISFASENSDITANAFEGNGGNINITTNTIFGLKFQPQQTDFSDITASSQFGLSGQVTINRLDVDPARGLVSLPSNLVDNSNQLAQGCNSNAGKLAQERNRFSIAGKGGLPSHPDDVFTGTIPLVDLVDIQTTKVSQESVKPVVINHNNQKVNLKNREIQQAQGWVFTDDGKVILTAESSQAIPQNTSLNNPGCEVVSQ